MSNLGSLTSNYCLELNNNNNIRLGSSNTNNASSVLENNNRSVNNSEHIQNPKAEHLANCALQREINNDASPPEINSLNSSVSSDTELEAFKGYCISNIRNTTQFKAFLQKYCQFLYKYLIDTNTCFVKGSFVIDDEKGFLKYLLGLFKNKKIKSVIPRTHAGFGPSKRGLCESRSGICEIHLKDFFVNTACPNEKETQTKTNIKFYFFNNIDNQDEKNRNPNRFMFFKLERFPTLNLKHTILAAKRYSTMFTQKEKQRREDCSVEDACVCTNDACHQKYVDDPIASKLQGESECNYNYDTHKRIGDEYFISSYINEKIFKLIMNNVTDFKFEACGETTGGYKKKLNSGTKRTKRTKKAKRTKKSNPKTKK
jgi:hypothetical protein